MDDHGVYKVDDKPVYKEFYKIILAIHKDQFQPAQKCLDRARKMDETELTALMRESYNRAYKTVITMQQLAELEEVINFTHFNRHL